MADPIKNDVAEFRNFGLLLGVLGTIFGGVPLLRHHLMPVWPWIATAVLWIVALLAPAALAYPHRAWMRLGVLLGWLNTLVILSLLYLVIMVPIALLMWWLERDPMMRKFDPARDSYRMPIRQRSANHLERPF